MTDIIRLNEDKKKLEEMLSRFNYRTLEGFNKSYDYFEEARENSRKIYSPKKIGNDDGRTIYQAETGCTQIEKTCVELENTIETILQKSKTILNDEEKLLKEHIAYGPDSLDYHYINKTLNGYKEYNKNTNIKNAYLENLLKRKEIYGKEKGWCRIEINEIKEDPQKQKNDPYCIINEKKDRSIIEKVTYFASSLKPMHLAYGASVLGLTLLTYIACSQSKPNTPQARTTYTAQKEQAIEPSVTEKKSTDYKQYTIEARTIAP